MYKIHYVLLAVTGLLFHVGIARTITNCSIALMNQADRTPVFGPICPPVINSSVNYNSHIDPLKTGEFSVRHGNIRVAAAEVRGGGIRYGNGTTGNERNFVEVFNLTQCILSGGEAEVASDIYRRSFSEVLVIDIPRKLSALKIQPELIHWGTNPQDWAIPFKCLAGEVSLPRSQSSVDEEQASRDFRPKKYFFAMGSAVLLVGVILLFKVLDKVYLDPRFDVDMAVGGFFFALALFVLGGWIIFHVFSLA